jgi:wyosine [tRNA(Phe)-imidazoG37] synthetase (radical SAM superfamily)
MATFLFDKIIFGPVKSRRLGVSLGINLLPNDCKLCSFNCIYCECGWNPKSYKEKIQLHPRDMVRERLEAKLLEMKNNNEAPDVITFAGNGEPTLHPDFGGIINDTIELRDLHFPNARIAVLSNSTMIQKESVFNALNRVEDNILKLDGGFEATIKTIDQPMGSFNLEKTIELLSKFKGNVTIQTLFLRGNYNGQPIDNTTEEELVAWLKHLERIQPKEVMIYTIARDTPADNLKKVPLDELNQIADRVKELGFGIQVSG